MKIKLLLILFITLFFTISCKNSEDNNSTIIGEDSVLSVSDKFEFERFYFAKKTDSGIKETEKPVYKRGDDVLFVMLNVGKFKEDTSGKHKMELRMNIKDKIGMVIEEQSNILNERGYRKLTNGIAKSPFARFKTAINDEPGTYLFTLTAVDLIANDSITVSDEYFLE